MIKRTILLMFLMLIGISFFPAVGVPAQGPGDPPEPPPPPLPTKDDLKREEDREKEEPGEELYGDIMPSSDKPWGLPEDLMASLAEKAELYRAYTRRFSCLETARTASYQDGEASDEKQRRYSFLLTTDHKGANFSESRRQFKDNGELKKDDVKDEEPFPPAYAWVFLFSSFNQPYFAYRDLGDRFDGFDWVRDIEFRGALPFTDGKDIRQWEGIVTIDAAGFTPLEIRAQPSEQSERIRAKFQRWMTAFNLVGFRLAPRPFGYRCRVEFHFRKDLLTFPTRLRYDTFRAVSVKQTMPFKASSRTYSEYRFFKVGTTEKINSPRE